MGIYHAVQKSKANKRKLSSKEKDKIIKKAISVGHVSSLMDLQVKKTKKLKKIVAEVYGLEDKEAEGFTRQLEAIGYDFSELKKKIEGHPKYKKHLDKYVSDALDNYFPPNYNPEAEEIAKARIDILSEVDNSRDGILREFLWQNCKEVQIVFKV